MTDDPKEEAAEPTREVRLPYERPAVISDEVFETLALSCANMARVCSGNLS